MYHTPMLLGYYSNVLSLYIQDPVMSPSLLYIYNISITYRKQLAHRCALFSNLLRLFCSFTNLLRFLASS